MEAIAFYLPQYHIIPENEALYGKGFTEWDNVRNAKSYFPGHKHPRQPHPIFGYYNLLDEKTIRLQHSLAYENGIGGFCYYYYNLSGKRLLEKPLDLINSDRTIKNKFCLCWDPQSWYNNRNNRKEIFIKQKFSPENARLIFSDLMRYFENVRYIRINGKPLLSIFAPERNPIMKEYAEIWREEAHNYGLPGLWLAGVEAFEMRNPALLGLDGMIEFAPNWISSAQVSRSDVQPRQLDYSQILHFMLSKNVPDWPYLRCAFPEWDNTPRRGKDGVVITGTSTTLYRSYLECLVEYTRAFLPEELQFIFINAWNEWGETCYLEPDTMRGFEYLKITRDVLKA